MDETRVHIPVLPEGLDTTIGGFNGQMPGPTIRARFVRPQVVQFVNRLPREVGNTCCTIHRHGGHQPPIDDGHPVEVVAPGTFKDYHFPNDTDSDVTLWYHDHELEVTGRKVNMDLAGIYPHESTLEIDLKRRQLLPENEHEIPLILMDRLFKADGSFNYPPADLRANLPLPLPQP
jgi:spore coat protein A